MPQSMNPSDSVIIGDPNAMAMMPEYANGQGFANTMEENPNTTKRADTVTPDKKEQNQADVIAQFEALRTKRNEAASPSPSESLTTSTTPRSRPS